MSTEREPLTYERGTDGNFGIFAGINLVAVTNDDCAECERYAKLFTASEVLAEALLAISERDPCNNLNGVDGSCMFNPECIGCVARAALRKAGL